MDASLNKQSTPVASKKKRRGRPKGSTNKKAAKPVAAKQPNPTETEVKPASSSQKRSPLQKKASKPVVRAQSAADTAGSEIELMIRGVLDLRSPIAMKMELIRTLIAKI